MVVAGRARGPALTAAPLQAALVNRGIGSLLCCVRDGAGQKLAFVYFEEESGRRSAAKLLTKDEARRITVNIAKLSALLLHA
jgi:hypothetical protein